MLTSEELKVLRGRGAKDADILKDYQEFDPESAGDIETLLKRGEKPSKILDGLASYYGSADAPKESKPDPMADKSVGQKTVGALQYGVANLARGLSKTAKVAGWKGTADTLEKGAKGIEPAPGTYEPAGARFDITDPSTYGYAPRALAEGAPGVVADLAGGAVGGLAGPAGAVAGFGAVNAARNFGPNLEARMENQGPGAQPTVSDYVASGASTAAEAALSRVGLNPALTSVAKGGGAKALAQVPKLIAKATGAEAAAGAAGDVINQVGRTAGTQEGLSVDPKEAANAAGLAGMTGGAIRTIRGAADVTNASRFRDVNPEAAARATSRLDANGIDPNNAKTSYEAVQMARKTLDTEINDAHQVIKPLLKTRGNDTDTDATRVLVKDTKTILKNHGEVNAEKLQELRNRLGDTEEGSRLVDLMEERQALNQLASTGRFDDVGKTFAGGIAAHPVVDGIVNPAKYLGQKITGVGLAGVAGLPMASQVAAMAPVLGQYAAAAAGGYGAIRAFDKVAGLRNPTQEFMNRFRGMQKLDGGDLPSFRQDAADQAAEAQAAREQAKAQKGQGRADNAEFKDNSRQIKEAVQLATATRKLRERQENEAYRDNSADLKQTIQSATASRKLREATEADVAKQATTRGKQEDTAWAQKRAQEAQDAKNAQQADKAWSQREESPEARQAQEEAMWKANDAQRTQAANDDLTAQEGIQSGLKALAAKALAAQQAREKQTDSAWTQKDRQDTAQSRLEATVNRDYGRAEAQRGARTPEQIKKAQEEAMWRDQEAPAPADYNEMDAIQAIQRELKARDNASQVILKQAQKEAPAPTMAPGEVPEGVPEALKVRVRARAKATKASEPETVTSDNPDVYRYTHGEQTVERSKDGIDMPQAYGAKVRSSMAARASFAKDLEDAAGPRQKPVIDAMLSKLNQNSRFWYKHDDPGRSAQHIIFETLDELPEKVRGKLEDIYNKHEGKLRGTYRE